ncbi:ribonuclease E inhibitor RraB [Jannaschia seohaensis]|uniref:Regulator of ribonuclease activity B n=1 Tax=Jannaschia seohaensis TaxID=475081 RepID=A0A2Y9BBR8_9RHOB|nr:ribonuclease E inhibitor RraB [Jannaschia seohaensis]PWJ10349.1 regulator of ribonuclease activity B [Jannaschia seohaensis]SSA51749.1 Regulator of ribonuclease activity B [Jannaschia seohaensis]
MIDTAAQEAASRAQWAEIEGQAKLPARAMIDLHFNAGPEADATEFMGWLEDRGYDVEHFPAEDDEEEAIEVQTPVVDLTLERILVEERTCSEAALRFGFVPAGWGFMGA